MGVAVFDAKTGAPLSFNREAVRIIDSLRMPDAPPEQLLQLLNVRRFDGQEGSLAGMPFSQLLSDAETLRAEELVLSMPDGRSITVLVNVTPMRTEDGAVESVVVTIQDMTPLEELEKLRAEFLGMVSHDLRTPLATIKGSISTLLNASRDMDPAETTQFHRIIDQQADRMRDLIADLLDVDCIETGTLPVTPEPAEVGALVDEARNNFQSGGGRDTLAIDMEPDLLWVMADRRRIVQVLGNLLNNAARYSHASSTIRVSAVLEECFVAIAVADEGQGVAPERLLLLFRKFSRIVDEDEREDTGLRGRGDRLHGQALLLHRAGGQGARGHASAGRALFVGA